MPKLNRRVLLQGAAALGAMGTAGAARGADAPESTAALDRPEARSPMKPYIGTATSRIDGRAKVTGAAKYAAEHYVPDLAYGFIVDATIAKGRIADIDASAALHVPGVLEVLTHKNRPPLAGSDKAWKDD